MPFPKGISPKVNLIAQLEFELTHYEIAIQHISHDTLRIPRKNENRYQLTKSEFHLILVMFLFSLFKGTSTPNGLLNVEIQFSCSALIIIVMIFSMFHMSKIMKNMGYPP